MNKKPSLSICLTEPVSFLPAGSSRNGTSDDSGPLMVRGLLTLTLFTRTRISGIEAELKGSSWVVWQEGLGSNLREVTEGRNVYSASVTFLGLNSENREGERWKEFSQGVYNYPISFAIPMNAPPSLDCAYGYVKWLLKAQVHRPGPLTKKLTSVRDVTLVPSPNTGPQDSGTRVFENLGDSRLRLVVILPSPVYHIGSRIPIEFTLRSLEKLNIYEISISLEERIDYYARMARIVRTEPLRRTQLLLLTSTRTSKDVLDPILPIPSVDTDVVQNSPWSRLISQQEQQQQQLVNPSDFLAMILGPGPWTFSHELQLPETCRELHFTTENIAANITITHTLKITVSATGKDTTDGRRCFKIVELIPLQILSCHCKPESISLPSYSDAPTDSSNTRHSCPCPIKDERPKSPLTLLRSTRTDNSSHRGSLFARGYQFERLVSGQESAAGEAPPPYAEVAS